MNLLNLLTKNTASNINVDVCDAFLKIKELYGIDGVSDDRKRYLESTIERYGYLPYPHYKTLNELNDAEIVFSFAKILELEGTFDGKKVHNFKNPSVLARNNVKNSNWFRKEGHNIKLISLSALGDGNKHDSPGTFIEWLAQIITLPRGNKKLGVLADTVYLIPFHPREFGCAYLPMSSDVSSVIEDDKLKRFLGMEVKEQVQLFIALAQLSGHPVIYDILPQTGRYSKIVLSKPFVARWFDIDELTKSYIKELEKVCGDVKLNNKFDLNEFEEVKKTYIEILKGSKKCYTEEQKPTYELIEAAMLPIKTRLSNEMSYKKKQEEILKRVTPVIEEVNGKKAKEEDDIIHQAQIVKALIKKGLWPAPGGAWCSSNMPVFDKMNKYKEYPVFKHFDHKCEDVTHFANLDCQTPYYFVHFETGQYNSKVIDFYLDYTKWLQKEFNFDGYRVDHIDHIVDEVSEHKGTPISYRIPRKVLGKANEQIKKNIPYFATLAEYMLWDDFYKEYHKDMNFDLLWGNDIVSQSSKTPIQIVLDNGKLEQYNTKNGGKNPLSILKGYNNQDGEFEAIDQYPGQLGEDGALFKWFKYKFLPGGRLANRPMLYIDGDESFTKTGIEYIIGKEVSMKRADNWYFYEKFNALNYFAQNHSVITEGKAKLIKFDEEGFACWEINAPHGDLFVVANYLNPTEKKNVEQKDSTSKIKTVKGHDIKNITVELEDRMLISYFEFSYDEMAKCSFEEKDLQDPIKHNITFNVLKPAEFKVYGFRR